MSRQKRAGYQGLRNMNWERPMRWLLAAVGPMEDVDRIGLLDPVQVLDISSSPRALSLSLSLSLPLSLSLSLTLT